MYIYATGNICCDRSVIFTKIYFDVCILLLDVEYCRFVYLFTVLVIPVLAKALVYDEKCGYFSFGANVRDAACYICWSFARAYDACEVAPYVETIAR